MLSAPCSLLAMLRRDVLSLCGLAAGSCLVPDAIARAIRDACVLADQPYLILPRDPSDTLYALTTDGTTDFTLHLGDPSVESTPPNSRFAHNGFRTARSR